MSRITDKKLAVVNGLWQVINLILITMLGVLLYKMLTGYYPFNGKNNILFNINSNRQN